MLTPTQYYKELKQILQAIAVEENKISMAKYMRNQFDFFGVKAPERKEVVRMFTKEHPIPEGENLKIFVEKCWKDKHREMQYAAMDIMTKKLKTLDVSFLEFFENIIQTKSWWDTVDWISPNGVGGILLRSPEKIETYPDRWIESDDFWLQRSAILFQLKYKTKTNAKLLFKYIKRRADSKEFFIQKASGWALREYAKYKPELVIEFVDNNELSNLTEREALRILKKKGVL